MKDRMRIGWTFFLAALAAVSLPSANAPAAEEATTVRISKSDCRRLVAHVPSPDVDYKPGVDARGRSVAPADLPGSPAIALPDTISFKILIDFSKYSTAKTYTPEGSVGDVKYDIRTGRFTFNGQPLESEDARELRVQCQRVLSGR